MNKLFVKVTNLSPMLLSSGEGWGSTIDNDIVVDSFGLPFFPAKRFKGLVRESALEVQEILHSPNFTEKEVDILFGREGDNESMLIFNDLHIREYKNTRNWLNYFQQSNNMMQISREEILDTYTSVIVRTSIDPDGIAKQNSLRTLRVLNANFSFYGEIESKGNNPDLHMVALALKNLKSAGTNRNRGLGKISISIYGDDNFTQVFPIKKEMLQ